MIFFVFLVALVLLELLRPLLVVYKHVSFVFLHIRFFVHALTLRLYRPVAGVLLSISRQARVAYAAVGVGVELCKVVSHRGGSRMPYLQNQTSLCNH